ncbi:MAG: hypothetical protein HUJ54_13385, partial [Erysipelotrichaceae bacterium]|nr:hypothetical protein [Erysipelotrichaceae bacterium]
IFTRLARIRAEEGNTEEAVRLYTQARWFLEQRISVHPFFGDLSIMKWLIRDLCQLTVPDPEQIRLYDLFELLKTPVTVTFLYHGRKFIIQSVMENGECVICFDQKWYRTPEDFMAKAAIDGRLLTSIYDELEDFQLTGRS